MSTQAVYGYKHINKNTLQEEEVLVQIQQDGMNRNSFAYALAMLKTKISGKDKKDMFKEIIDIANDFGGSFKQFGAINLYSPNESFFGSFVKDASYRRGSENKSILDDEDNVFLVEYDENNNIKQISIKDQEKLGGEILRYSDAKFLEDDLKNLNKEVVTIEQELTEMLNDGSIKEQFEHFSPYVPAIFSHRDFGAERDSLKICRTEVHDELYVFAPGEEAKKRSGSIPRYNYFIRQGAYKHTAFGTKEEFVGWLDSRGLSIDRIPEIGSQSGSKINGLYVEHSCYGVLPNGKDGSLIRKLSNGDYTKAVAKKENDGLVHIYYHNPNEKKHIVKYDYFETQARLEEGNYAAEGLSEKGIYVKNDNNQKFYVRLLEKGDQYGKDFSLKYEENEPLVEFYDTECFKDQPYGQFVSRYAAATLLGKDGIASNAHKGDLSLDSGIPEWTVDSNAMNKVMNWLESNSIVQDFLDNAASDKIAELAGDGTPKQDLNS